MKKKYSLFVPLLLLSINCFCQVFTKIIPQNSIGLVYSHNAWFDFDNDGDLDFLITGEISTNELKTVLYENLGNDIFRPALSPYNSFPQYSESEIAFLNTNGDDRIDLLLMGRRIGDARTNRISLLENRTTGFVDLNTLSDFGKAQGHGTISIGDVDSNGSSDIFLSGITDYVDGSPVLSAFLYINKNNSFTKNLTSKLTGLYIATSKFADLDNDNDLDLIICGSDGHFPYQKTQVYFNDGEGNFQISNIQLSALQNPSIDLADFDGDNYLDVLLTGLDGNLDNKTILYKNTIGSLEKVITPDDLNRTASGSAKWGDYDNDGDQDILITGQGGNSSLKLSIFENDGIGQFTAINELSFETIGIGYASWGDYDNDGDLDILVTGSSSSSNNEIVPTLYVLKNGTNKKNIAPSTPKDFRISYKGSNSCELNWTTASDELTPAKSITYNISVKNMTTSKFLQYPFSNNSSGKRSVTEPGNVWLNTRWKLNNLENGSYLLKIQAIDGGFIGSGWSEEKYFYSGLPSAPSNLNIANVSENIVLSWSDNSDNEKYFFIERKSGDGPFIKIDSVSSNVVNYTDHILTDTHLTYRVYSSNPNQNSNYSNSVNILVTGIESDLHNKDLLYPNPVTDVLMLSVENTKGQNVYANVFNSIGSAVLSKILVFNDENNSLLETKSLQPGYYYIELKTNTRKIFFKKFYKK